MVANATEQSVPRPSMTVDGEFTDGYGEFLGVVIADEWTWSDVKKAWQWHLAVKPTDIAIQGATGAFHCWAKATQAKNSVLGVQREAFMGFLPPGTALGEGLLTGTGAWWKRETIPFGTNRETGEEMKAEGILIPLRLASPEEQERIAQHGGSPASSVMPVAEAKAEGLSREQLEEVTKLCAERTAQEIMKAASSRECKLPREIRQGLISGTLLATLVESGNLYYDDLTEKYADIPF
jgi:hypothetical protein